MKKSIIAAGAASVALAAMPIVGVFAFDEVHDNVSANIDDGCTITDAVQNKTVSISVAPGGVGTSVAAPSISVTCNNNDWSVTALGSTTVPAGYSEGTATDLIATHTGDTTTYDRIATGTATTGGSSNWAFKVAQLSDTTNASVATDFDAWHAIPSGTAAVIVNGTGATTETVHTQYQVYAALGQAAGNYEGQVTYTVVENNA